VCIFFDGDDGDDGDGVYDVYDARTGPRKATIRREELADPHQEVCWRERIVYILGDWYVWCHYNVRC